MTRPTYQETQKHLSPAEEQKLNAILLREFMRGQDEPCEGYDEVEKSSQRYNLERAKVCHHSEDFSCKFDKIETQLNLFGDKKPRDDDDSSQIPAVGYDNFPPGTTAAISGILHSFPPCRVQVTFRLPKPNESDAATETSAYLNASAQYIVSAGITFGRSDEEHRGLDQINDDEDDDTEALAWKAEWRGAMCRGANAPYPMILPASYSRTTTHTRELPYTVHRVGPQTYVRRIRLRRGDYKGPTRVSQSIDGLLDTHLWTVVTLSDTAMLELAKGTAELGGDELNQAVGSPLDKSEEQEETDDELSSVASFVSLE